MGQILVRNIDDGALERLRRQAKRNKRSLEAEVRNVLETSAQRDFDYDEFIREADAITAGSARFNQTDSAVLRRIGRRGEEDL
jgi:plasmid stability protein